MLAAVEELAPVIGIKPACEVLGVKRATLYRRKCRHRRAGGEPTSLDYIENRLPPQQA